MKAKDPDLFSEPYLKFRVRKPSAWRFMPPAWSPVAQMKNAIESPDDWIHLAKLPFCYAMGNHDSRVHAFPTLQATVRPFSAPDNKTASTILDAQVDMLAQQYEDFELLSASSDAIIGGHRAIMLRGTFLLPTQPDDELIYISVLSRSFVVFALGRAFTLGLSGSADERYYHEPDFDSIIGSVRFGT